jgi:hypothetical protein
VNRAKVAHGAAPTLYREHVRPAVPCKYGFGARLRGFGLIAVIMSAAVPSILPIFRVTCEW